MATADQIPLLGRPLQNEDGVVVETSTHSRLAPISAFISKLAPIGDTSPSLLLRSGEASGNFGVAKAPPSFLRKDLPRLRDVLIEYYFSTSGFLGGDGSSETDYQLCFENANNLSFLRVGLNSNSLFLKFKYFCEYAGNETPSSTSLESDLITVPIPSENLTLFDIHKVSIRFSFGQQYSGASVDTSINDAGEGYGVLEVSLDGVIYETFGLFRVEPTASNTYLIEGTLPTYRTAAFHFESVKFQNTVDPEVYSELRFYGLTLSLQGASELIGGFEKDFRFEFADQYRFRSARNELYSLMANQVSEVTLPPGCYYFRLPQAVDTGGVANTQVKVTLTDWTDTSVQQTLSSTTLAFAAGCYLDYRNLKSVKLSNWEVVANAGPYPPGFCENILDFALVQRVGTWLACYPSRLGVGLWSSLDSRSLPLGETPQSEALSGPSRLGFGYRLVSGQLAFESKNTTRYGLRSTSVLVKAHANFTASLRVFVEGFPVLQQNINYTGGVLEIPLTRRLRGVVEVHFSNMSSDEVLPFVELGVVVENLVSEPPLLYSPV